MSTMKEFMQETEVRGFLNDIQIKLNKTAAFNSTIISDDVLETAIEVFDHIYKTYKKLEEHDEEHASVYIASCLGSYIMLFNAVSEEEVILDS